MLLFETMIMGGKKTELPFGIFGGGEDVNGNAYSTTDKYTYSGDTVTSGTNLGTARSVLSAAGNYKKGIFAGGVSYLGSGNYNFYSITDKYTYSGDTVTAGTNLTTNIHDGASVGNESKGIFSGMTGSYPSVIIYVGSDIRMKTDISLIGSLMDGINIYKYRYIWSDEIQVGVMAQEVLKIIPEAVKLFDDGYYRVNYTLLLNEILSK